MYVSLLEFLVSNLNSLLVESQKDIIHKKVDKNNEITHLWSIVKNALILVKIPFKREVGKKLALQDLL